MNIYIYIYVYIYMYIYIYISHPCHTYIHAKFGIPNLLQSPDICEKLRRRYFQFSDFLSIPYKIKLS